jgi:hypothetical protein
MDDQDRMNCSECMKLIVRGYFVGPGDERAFLCSSCSRHFCNSCGFFDEHDDEFLCNLCWLMRAKGLISNEKYLAAMWIFKKMGRSRDVEEMKSLEAERRKRLNIKDEVLEDKKGGFIRKD